MPRKQITSENRREGSLPFPWWSAAGPLAWSASGSAVDYQQRDARYAARKAAKKNLDHQTVVAVTLTLEVRPVTGRASSDHAILGFEVLQFVLQTGDLRFQGLDVRLVPLGDRAGCGLYWISARSILIRTFPSLPVCLGNRKRRTSDRAASWVVPSRSAKSA